MNQLPSFRELNASTFHEVTLSRYWSEVIAQIAHAIYEVSESGKSQLLIGLNGLKPVPGLETALIEHLCRRYFTKWVDGALLISWDPQGHIGDNNLHHIQPVVSL